MRQRFVILVVYVAGYLPGTVIAQISPGTLSRFHSHLEGMSNCTSCHTLGAKVTNEKCLACHTDLKERIDQNKGYHVSSGVKGKSCVTCHSDHHGLNFDIVRFSKENFNHALTGYNLLGAHAKKGCTDCHKAEFIQSHTIRNKKTSISYLGLNTSCLSCHDDYHQKTLSTDCAGCHGMDSFKPAVRFSHTSTQFPLKGMHREVECAKCHAVTTRNSKPFQEFALTGFQNCSLCHADPHQGKFGQRCAECHSEASFHTIRGMTHFDHSKTRFSLEGKHQAVSCTSCHRSGFSAPLKYTRCTDCHADYHNGDFVQQGKTMDCSQCHSVSGFTGSSFTVAQHNQGDFFLRGAHLATPCFACHKKEEKWSFRNIGARCADCHQNVHSSAMSSRYSAEKGCENCHDDSRWSSIRFDHSVTTFPLAGAHEKQSCRSCHFRKEDSGKVVQQFAGLSTACITCHKDIHYGQFETEGKINCSRCHDPRKWKIDNFDHNSTTFKLDGKHALVACDKCHKTVTDGQHSYILYKIKETKCENCH